MTTLQFYHKTLKPEKKILAIALQRYRKITTYYKIVMKLKTELPVIIPSNFKKTFEENENHISV